MLIALPFNSSTANEIDVIADFHNGIHVVTYHNSCGTEVICDGANEVVYNNRGFRI